MAEFQTRKDNHAEYRIVNTESLTDGAALSSGEVIVKVSKFAYTANNITYAVAGDMLGYWQFFPPKGDDVEGWGIVPVWGFAEVIQSEHADVPVGEKLFGFLPPVTDLRMTPDRVSEKALFDVSTHRAHLPPTYNLYQRVDSDAAHDPSADDAFMLLWPLYSTGYCLADLLLDKNWYGAEQILVLSASSKTSIGLGYALNELPDAPKVIGLTSERNHAFVSQLGVYDDVHNYQQLSNIDCRKPTVIVDMAGNNALLGDLHELLNNNMKFTINVGITHWDQTARNDKVISERSEFFFAPDHIKKRAEEWGPKEFSRRSAIFVSSAIKSSGEWLQITPHQGLEGLGSIYQSVCDGQSSSSAGHIIEMN